MLGQRSPPPLDLVIALKDLPPPPAHPFYDRLNALLEQAAFDPFVENLCRPYYAEGVGRPSIPPGVYFRMLLFGYFEGLGSQRAIAWRCADSRSVLAFLGLPPHKPTPDHSSLTKIRLRLPDSVHQQVFVFVLKLAEDNGLQPGPTAGVDSTLLEANAAMKSIVRRDNGDDWQAYLRQLAVEAGIKDPTAEDLRRFDRQRRDKKVPNEEWVSPSDPDSRIAKMKDGSTHLAYKAEHVVDLATELILAAEVYPADQPDSATLLDSVAAATVNLQEAESGLPLEELEVHGEAAVAELTVIDEAVADKGYHKAETLADCAAIGLRTYIPEERRGQDRVWTDKPAAWERAYRNNRRRVAGSRSKRLQKLRSEKLERTFAHVCETGGGRRSWLRGLAEVSKRYLMQATAHNLGIIMRWLHGPGTPRSLQGRRTAVLAYLWGWLVALVHSAPSWSVAEERSSWRKLPSGSDFATRHIAENLTFSTGCWPKCHYTRRVQQLAVRLVAEDGLPYQSVSWHLWRDHRVFVPFATIQNWVEAAGEKKWGTLQTDYFGEASTNFSGYLAIDEVYDGPFCILSVVDNRRYNRLACAVLDHDPTHHDMRAFLTQVKGLLDQRGLTVRGITTDGSPLYPKIIKELWPEAKHQLCEFHVLKEITKAVLRALAKLRKELKAQLPKRRRGRPKKQEQAQRRHSQRLAQRVADLFEHRHLFVRHHLSAAQKKQLKKLTRGLPQLRALRSIMDEVYRLFDRRCKTATALRRLKKLRRRVHRFKRLGRALAKLDSPRLEKALLFLDDKLLGATSNAVERANRRFRKAQQSIYSVRTKEHLQQRLALDMNRELHAAKRARTLKTLHHARSDPDSGHCCC